MGKIWLRKVWEAVIRSGCRGEKPAWLGCPQVLQKSSLLNSEASRGACGYTVDFFFFLQEGESV